MVFNKTDLIREIRGDIVRQGVDCHNRSRFYNTIGMGKLIDAIIDKLTAQGMPAEKVRDVMLYNMEYIPAAARGVQEDANRYLERYLAVPHPADEFPPADGHESEGGMGTQGGNGGNTSTGGGSSSASSSSQGNGESDGGDGDSGGDSDGDGDNGEGDGSDSPDGGASSSSDGESQSGQGDGDSQQGSGQDDNGDEGDNNGGGEGEGESPNFDLPEPPTEPPIKEQVRQIIRWNLAHPGEEKNILLVGPAGIGKTRLVFDISQEFFNKKPYAVTAPQMEFRIVGFNDAMGREIKTPITKGYVDEGGAIILIDEIDRMDANAGIALNMATANKSMDTPNGMISQAPGVTFIATANTSGTGATNDFNTANQLDKSTRDRWVYLLIKWDHNVAMGVAKGDEALVKGLEDWNSACESMQYTSGLVSYRTIIDVLDLIDMGVFTFEEAIQAAMLKYAIPKSNLMGLYDAMKDHYNKVAKAIKKIMDQMPDNDNTF